MQSLLIFLALCFLLGWAIFLIKDSFDKDESWVMKLLSILVFILVLGLMCGSLFGLRETMRHQALDDYFEGQVEVIEQFDTLRTYKFIKHE